MKNLLFLIFIICAQISFAQYTFKYDSTITQLEEIVVENRNTNSSNSSKIIGFSSKLYKTSFGDTVTIMPKIAIIVKNPNEIERITNQFGNKLTFIKKIGCAFIFNCGVQNSDEVLEITTELSKDEEVIGCDAIKTGRIQFLNTLYPKQYYLHPTSSSSKGTNVEAAWEIASGLGRNITVAVIDEGVEHNHEDLPNVLEGYTRGYPNGNGEPITLAIYHNPHGVACAGIIGAANNNIGIRGIASNAKILPINLAGDGSTMSDEEVADAINWASKRADVLSCSWSLTNGESITVTEAIKDAIANGRNGKGCVVVFSSGNNAPYINGLSYPAKVEGVISVGAVKKDGKIWSYSQRGTGLSLVAPSGDINISGDIVTTDRMGSIGYSTGNYTEKFGGTSAACPQVAGVAALLLSIRPDLTVEEIRNVLQNTATDLGTTGYDTTYGYGLLNAEAAVKAVAPKINGKDIAQSTSTYTLTALPENAIVSWRVEEENKDKITLTPSGNGNSSCTVKLSKNKTVGTRLIAEIKVNGITVATVSKNIAILGMFSGTYSVPAVTISGVSLPAIVDRPFFAGSTLEARSGCYVYIKSDDLRYYTASWSGNRIENWTYNGLDELSFSYPATASSRTTILQFKDCYGGSVKVNVRPTNPPTTVHVSQEGQTLSVAVIEETQDDYGEFVTGIDEISKVKSCDQVWTIEVLNAVTGSALSAVTTSTGKCEFNTSAWPSGIYLIRVSNGTDVISKKITIQ